MDGGGNVNDMLIATESIAYKVRQSLTQIMRLIGWAEARVKITRMTLTIKLDRNWSSFQLANSAPPLSVTGSAIAPSARMARKAARIIVGEYTAMAQVACRRWCVQLGMAAVGNEALAKPKLSWRVAMALK